MHGVSALRAGTLSGSAHAAGSLAFERLFLQAMPLLLFPRLLLFFTQSASLADFTAASSRTGRGSGDHYDALTALEAFLCSMLGWGCIAFASVCLITVRP